MKIIKQANLKGSELKKFDSKNLMHYPIFKTSKPSYLSVLKLEKNGVIGFHQATSNQLMIIMKGSGWVRSNESDKISVTEGDFIYWKNGEWHETGTETEMTGLVFESVRFDLFQNI